MSLPAFHHIRLGMLKDVMLVEVLTKDLRGPELAQELGAELTRAVTARDDVTRFLLDFRHTSYLSSTGFAVLVKLVSQVQASGGQIKVCNMDPDVRVGADIIGLGGLVEIHESEDSALRAFEQA